MRSLLLAEECGFVIMTENQGTGKYELMGQLKTWSAYKREQVRNHRDEDREGKRGSGGVGGRDCGSPRGLEKAGGGNGYQDLYTYDGCSGGCSHARGIETSRPVT